MTNVIQFPSRIKNVDHEREQREQRQKLIELLLSDKYWIMKVDWNNLDQLQASIAIELLEKPNFEKSE